MSKKVSVIVSTSVSKLHKGERDISVDDVKRTRDTHGVELDGASAIGGITSEVSQMAGNQRAPKDMRSLVKAKASKR
jgi:hypothetical protein